MSLPSPGLPRSITRGRAGRALDDRMADRLALLADGYDDEAVQAALDGRPRRAWYLEQWVQRTRQAADDARMAGYVFSDAGRRFYGV